MKIFIKVKTRAKIKRLVKIDGTHYVISVGSPPEKGRANKEILKTLSDYFDLPVSKIKIVSGEKTKEKIIEIINI